MVQFTFECGKVSTGHRIDMCMHWFGIGIDANMHLSVRIHTKRTIKQLIFLFEDCLKISKCLVLRCWYLARSAHWYLTSRISVAHNLSQCWLRNFSSDCMWYVFYIVKVLRGKTFVGMHGQGAVTPLHVTRIVIQFNSCFCKEIGDKYHVKSAGVIMT